MKRTSTLDLMRKNYNVRHEVEKLKKYFFEIPMFNKSGYTFKRPTWLIHRMNFTYSEIFDKLVFRDWEFCQTFLTLKEMFTQNNLFIDIAKEYTDEQIIDFIELIENLLYVKLNYNLLKTDYGLILIKDDYNFMLKVLKELIKHLDLNEMKDPEGWIVLVPKNEILNKIIENFSPDIQWEIVSYLKIKGDDIEAKRKQLAYLATLLYIESDTKESAYQPFKTIMNECTLILNNLNIRHNNETGKWENNVVKNINKTDAVEYCDLLYDKMMQIVLMRKILSKQEKINNLSKLLKDKNKK